MLNIFKSTKTNEPNKQPTNDMMKIFCLGKLFPPFKFYSKHKDILKIDSDVELRYVITASNTSSSSADKQIKLYL